MRGVPNKADKPNAWRIYTDSGEHVATVYDAAMRDYYLAQGFTATPVTVKDPRW